MGMLRQWGRLVAFRGDELLACGVPPEGVTVRRGARRRGAQVPSGANPWQKGSLAIVYVE